ncbi:MAG: DUF123 domain-containing protein [Chloroflexi bacterium]|nr:DUF123 domain-containing protein [Chloroflexota bacterium]
MTNALFRFGETTLATGAYVLRILLRRPADIRFGRFNQGQPIFLTHGEYAYVGSAMGTKGASQLGSRLLRHATRSEDHLPHPIRHHLEIAFRRPPPRQKTPFWHIDYLLDSPAAELTHVYAVHASLRLEVTIAALLQENPHTTVIVPGLGASDARQHTHLLRVAADERWWTRWLVNQLEALEKQKPGMSSPG